jgi:hypothetical protein
LVFGESTPGIVTAVLINLPIMSILLFQAVREQRVSGTKAIACALLVPLAIGVAIFGPVCTSLMGSELSIPLLILHWGCPEPIGGVAAGKH